MVGVEIIGTFFVFLGSVGKDSDPPDKQGRHERFVFMTSLRPRFESQSGAFRFGLELRSAPVPACRDGTTFYPAV